jgi:chromosome segregation ATPase
MNIINDQPNVDYVTYFTQQLPKDLAAMAQLRDELAKRQGAMSAVEKANKDREKAAQELADASAKAAVIVKGAEEVAQANDAKKVDLDAQEAALLAKQKAFLSEAALKTVDLGNREQQVANRESAVAALQNEYVSKLQSIDADRVALDARIKAFQDKVAALTV